MSVIRKWYSKLLFSIIVTLFMNALDMTYHLSTAWAVHLNYAVVKLTLIFLAVYLITTIIGFGKEEGIVTSILGPFMFYLYYVFANPTLDRTVFLLDEQFWFFFLHVAMMLIAYFVVWRGVAHARIKQPGQTVSRICAAAAVWWSVMAAELIFLMITWRLQGIEEEPATMMMTFALAWPLVLTLLLACVLGMLTNYSWIAALIAGLGFGILVGLPSSIFGFIIVWLVWNALEMTAKETAESVGEHHAA